jgi:hypothetical protein
MSQIQDLDPRVKGFEAKAKVVGVAVVAVATAAAVAVAATTVVAAGVMVVAALVTVNFVPVAARRLALWKQGMLTKLAEEFSEETIREDERKEAERVDEAGRALVLMKSELQGSIEELRKQKSGASPDEISVIDNQISTLEGVIVDQENDLRQQQQDLKDLQRVNGLLIAMDRSARAMNKARGSKRDPEEQQRLVTSRNAIKTRMRSAIAGQQVDAMRREVDGNFSTPSVAALGHSEPRTISQPLPVQENVNVPTRR